MSNNPILTISICVSKNIDEVKRCLDSLSTLMNQVDCELILTDTSNDEDIHNLCLGYTNHVINFEWCNDFAKARNVGINAANGQWFFFLDDDEWLEDSDEIISFFTTKQYQKYNVANLYVRNFYDIDMSFYGDIQVTRLFSLKNNVTFQGKIHEFPTPLNAPSIELSTRIMHSGYIAVTEEDTRKKFNRNFPILEEMILEEPGLLRWRVQAAQELVNAKEWEKLIEICQKGLDDKDVFEDLIPADLDTLRAGLIEGLVESGKTDDAISSANLFINSSDVCQLCKAYIHLQLVSNYVRLNDFDKASANLEEYYSIKEYFDKHENELNTQKIAFIISRTFEDFLLMRANSLKMTLAIKTNNEAIMAFVYPKLKWNEKVIYLDKDLMNCLKTDGVKMLENQTICQAFADLWNNSEAASTFINYAQTGTEPESLEGVERAIAFFCETNPKGQILFDYAFEVEDPTEHLTRMVATAREYPAMATVIKNYMNIYKTYL